MNADLRLAILGCALAIVAWMSAVVARAEVNTSNDSRGTKLFRFEFDNDTFVGSDDAFTAGWSVRVHSRLLDEWPDGIGPCSRADDVQRFVHDRLRFGESTAGWANQLDDDALVNVNYEYRYKVSLRASRGPCDEVGSPIIVGLHVSRAALAFHLAYYPYFDEVDAALVGSGMDWVHFSFERRF